MSWRDPLVATPQGVTAVAEAGGSLPAGSYGYRVVARRLLGSGHDRAVDGLGRSAGDDGGRRRGAGALAGRRRAQPSTASTAGPSGGETIYWTVTGTEFIDTGASGSSEAVPTSTGTLWSVKNLFELKNARNVVIVEETSSRTTGRNRSPATRLC